jgi:hypothetical protein
MLSRLSLCRSFVGLGRTATALAPLPARAPAAIPQRNMSMMFFYNGDYLSDEVERRLNKFSRYIDHHMGGPDDMFARMVRDGLLNFAVVAHYNTVFPPVPFPPVGTLERKGQKTQEREFVGWTTSEA